MKTTTTLNRNEIRDILANHIAAETNSDGSAMNIQFRTGASAGGLEAVAEIGVEQQPFPEPKKRAPKKSAAKAK